LPAAEPTLESVGPTELVTLERPSDALDAACEVLSLAVFAASLVVLALRIEARWNASRGCRNKTRADILSERRRRVGKRRCVGDGYGVSCCIKVLLVELFSQECPKLMPGAIGSDKFGMPVSFLALCEKLMLPLAIAPMKLCRLLKIILFVGHDIVVDVLESALYDSSAYI
jgi:hypothetical protein